MKIYKYQLYCQFCHYRKIFGDEDINDLSLQKSVDVQAGIPILDPITKKTEPSEFKKGKYKSKCPKCGRVIFVTKYYEPKQEDNTA